MSAGINNHEWLALKRSLIRAQEQLPALIARRDQFQRAIERTESLGALINLLYSPNHHLLTNHQILWLTLRDDLSTADNAIAKTESEIQHLQTTLSDSDAALRN